MFGGGNINTLLSGEENLANYLSSLLPTAVSMGNYAANLATGGAALPAPGPSTSSFLDPGNEFFGRSAQDFNPSGQPYYPGLGGAAVGAAPGVAPGGTVAGAAGPGFPTYPTVPGAPTAGAPAFQPGTAAGSQTHVQVPQFLSTPEQGGAFWYNAQTGQATTSDGKPANLTPDQQAFLSARGLLGTYRGGTGAQIQTIAPGSGQAQMIAQNYPGMIGPSTWTGGSQVPGSVGTGGGGGAVAGGGGGRPAPVMTGGSPQDSLINEELSALNLEKQIAGTPAPGMDPATLAGLQNTFFGNAAQTAGLSTSALGQSAADILNANKLNAQGLFPDQEAMVDAATTAAKAQTTQNLANMGLGSSTQAAMLGGELEQQGAAQKGQLIQGNIQLEQAYDQLAQGWQQTAQNWQSLGQNWAKLGVGEQEISQQVKDDTFNMFQGISQQYGAAQNTLWQQALSGYGLLNSFVNSLLGVYGQSTNDFNALISAATAGATNQTNLEIAQMRDLQQNQSSMMSGLGSILGSVGGLIGGGGAAAGGIGAGIGSAAAGTDVAGLTAGLVGLAGF